MHATSRAAPAAARAALAVALLAAGLAAAAAQSNPVRLRGPVESITPTGFVVKARSQDVPVQLPENARVIAVARAALADIKTGSYVGVAGLPNPDGSQRALEVLIFPESMRGTGEGFRPWDLMPESTMTNATVAETVTKAEGRTLSLRYKDGEKTIVVPPDAPIVTFASATRADIKPGIRVVATVAKAQDGTEMAASVIVGRDGVDPPM